MKKYFCVFILLFALISLISVNIELHNIKTVKSTTIRKAEYSDNITVTGEFESQDKTSIQLSYPVFIKDVYVKENSYVNKGQAIFSIDKAKMMEILNGEYQDNLTDYIDYTQIYNISSTNNINAEAIYNIPDTVYASSAGIVTQLNIYPGAVVMANQNIAVLNHTDNIVAKFTLSQIDYGRVKVGDKVNITPVAFRNVNYKGIINSDNAVIKKQNTTVGNKVVIDVFATITNPDNKVADGLQINGTITSGEPLTINTIDYSFINQDEKGQYVFIYDRGKAKKVYIETGVETASYTEIKTEFNNNTIFVYAENLKDGERIILNN